MDRRMLIGWVIVAACVAASPSSAEAEGHGHAQKAAGKQAEMWTCSMHPQIRRMGPGTCPICGMDLVPAAAEEQSADLGPREMVLSARARKLAEVEVAPVERRYVSLGVQMVGKVQYDETRLGYVTAWVGGRLDRLFVNYTGSPVKQGDPMVSIYSPELLTAQQELLQAGRGADELKQSNLPDMRDTARKTVEAAREKLRLWGLTAAQIAEIEKRGTPSDHITITSPISGIVIAKEALDGMYVNTGTRIYTIADLSTVWLVLDAYESDIGWLRYGQDIDFKAAAYPGEVFNGRVAFIDPVLADATRTVKVRVNVRNADGRLKPGMFGHGSVSVKLAEHAAVMNTDLAGKWISPQHPEIVKDEPGNCEVCGVPLVRAETLGYVAGDTAAPLVVPATAVLLTGKRGVVYVEVPGKDGAYEGREVVLGPRAGHYYLVEKGLHEGELVVVKGNFKIDSSLQILAKPSMMDPASEPSQPKPSKKPVVPKPYDLPEAFKVQLAGVFSAYFEIQQALSKDDPVESQAAAKRLLAALDAVDMNLLAGNAHKAWMKERENIAKSMGDIVAAGDIDKSRAAFATLSETLAVVARRFGTSGKQRIIRFHCPMAFDNRGGDWLQGKSGIQNPYFGSAMFKCGEQVEVIQPGN